MDRIDIHVEVPVVPSEALRQRVRGEASTMIRERVVAARERQLVRFAGNDGTHCNAQMSPADQRLYCELDDAGHRLLENVVDRLGMSARAYDRILKVARTIADLEGSETLSAEHVAEAIQYRILDRDIERSTALAG